ncbi:glycoside hydrolase superfamily [Obelidium mucronatum]|nr:glycoside hydrolase superfamily [Obelidium mucronatum]
MKAILLALLLTPYTVLSYDFAWGFGGSAYQTEGAWNLDDKDVGIFDYWYHQPARAHLANADVASDQYHRYKEDLKLLPQLGATLYRFSVSWPRVMTGCTARINPKGIAFYNSMIDEVIANGAIPFLTMYHWDMPQACFEQFQGFADDRIIEEFVKYADVLYNAFGNRVKYWLTINEPESNCKFGFQQGRLAPGYKNDTYQATIDCVHRSHKLHGAVVNLAKTKYKSVERGWKFGWPSNVEWNEPVSSSPSDIAAAEARNLAYAGWYNDPLVFGDYQEDLIDAFRGNRDHLDAVGRAPPVFTEAEKATMKGTVDFIAMNYYSTAGLQPSQVDVPSGAGCPAYCWQHTFGQGARKMANWYYKRYNMDIIITELGFAAVGEADMTIDQIVHNPDRLRFWQTHATAVAQALEEDKVPVKGMLVWSLVDNFEWGYYDQRFGAVAVVGLGTPQGSLERVVKNSTYWLADFYRSKNYVDPFHAIIPPTKEDLSKDQMVVTTSSKGTTSGGMVISFGFSVVIPLLCLFFLPF